MSFPVWVSELEYDLHKCGTMEKGLYALVDVNEVVKMAKLLYELEDAIEHERTLTRTKHYLPLKHLVDSILEVANDVALQQRFEKDRGSIEGESPATKLLSKTG